MVVEAPTMVTVSHLESLLSYFR